MVNDANDAPARYSDEANLEPVARAAEVTPEIETEVPEASEHVETEPERAGTFSNTSAAPPLTAEQLKRASRLLLDSPRELRVQVEVVPPWLWYALRRPDSGE